MASSTASGSTVANYRRGKNPVRGIPRRCHCGEGTVMRTSTTPTNPGRLFHVCPFRSEENKSHLFKWTDESIVEEVEDIRVGLQIIAGDVARMGMGGNSTINRSGVMLSEQVASQSAVTQLSKELEELKALVVHGDMEMQIFRAKIVNMKRFIALTLAVGIAYCAFFG